MLKQKKVLRQSETRRHIPKQHPNPTVKTGTFGGKVSVGNPCVHDELVPGKAKQRDHERQRKYFGLKEDKLPEPGKPGKVKSASEPPTVEVYYSRVDTVEE